MTVTAKGESLFSSTCHGPADRERQFNRTPNELFITSRARCIAITHPRQIPSQTVWLAEPRQVNVKEALERYAGLPEELVVWISCARLPGEADDSAVVQRTRSDGAVTARVWLNEERGSKGSGSRSRSSR